MFQKIRNNLKNYFQSTNKKCKITCNNNNTDIFCAKHKCLNCRNHGIIDLKYESLLVLFISLVILIYYSSTIYNPISKEKDDKSLIPPNPISPLAPSKSKLHVFKNSAVCSDAAACAQIGTEILQQNGSVIDAAIAAMICDGIINMHSMGLGGGFLMTVFKKRDNKVYSVNARETAPINAKNTMFKEKNAQSEGGLAMGIPGQIKGFSAVHQRFGKLPFRDLVTPSIKICENGYRMTRHQHLSLKFKKNLSHDENFKKWFYNENGKFKKTNSTIIPYKLCETLKILAENGPNDFYTGLLSKLFLKDIEEVGGIITAEDLKNYEVEWQEPFSVPLKNGDWFYSSPPPGSGAIAGFILNIIEGYNFTSQHISDVQSTIDTYHTILESFKYAYAKRTDLGDPNFVNMKKVLKELSSKNYAKEVRLKINKYKTFSDPNHYGATFFSKTDQGTAHLSVIAPNGDAVSVTSTINIFFGAGITSKRTGIIFNSIMDDFSFPWIINFFGLCGSPKNKMEPGKRPLSSMAPTIIIDKNNNVKFVVGAAGGSQITTSIALTLIRVLWLGNNLKEALDAPRIHHQLAPMNVQYEYGTLEQIVTGLRRLGHNMKRGTGSVVCALQKIGKNIFGNADYRKGGDVFGN